MNITNNLSQVNVKMLGESACRHEETETSTLLTWKIFILNFYWTFRCFSFLFWCLCKVRFVDGAENWYWAQTDTFPLFLLAFFTHHHNPIRHLHCSLCVESERAFLRVGITFTFTHHTECIVARRRRRKSFSHVDFKWMFESVQTYGKISWVNLRGGRGGVGIGLSKYLRKCFHSSSCHHPTIVQCRRAAAMYGSIEQLLNTTTQRMTEKREQLSQCWRKKSLINVKCMEKWELFISQNFNLSNSRQHGRASERWRKWVDFLYQSLLNDKDFRSFKETFE